jgi:DNA polymerase III epsilon subunit-like protein
MHWKTWKNLIRESHLNEQDKEISFIKDGIEETKELLNDLISKKFIFFDLETAGLNRWSDQITQIAAIAVSMKKTEEDKVEIEIEDKMDITAFLSDEMKARLNPESPERKAWEIRTINDALYFATKKGEERIRIKSLEEIANLPEKLQNIAKEKLKDLDPEFPLKLTGYDENNATHTERDALKQFMLFLKKHPGSILTGHNSKRFDIPFTNERIKFYTQDKSKIKNIQDFSSVMHTLDTLLLSRSVFLPALKQMQTNFGNILKQIDARLEPEEISESEEEKQLAKQNIVKMGDDYVQSFTDEEKKKLAKYKYLFTILKTKVDQTLDNLKNERGHSSRMGDIAKVFGINAEGWHNALADILMLADVFNAMRRTINLASKMSLQQLQEMEPYQKEMHSKHPKWKSRLTRGGSVKDKSTPYKKKLSLKRGKSAPPGG